jgi:hypothetical protein
MYPESPPATPRRAYLMRASACSQFENATVDFA